MCALQFRGVCGIVTLCSGNSISLKKVIVNAISLNLVILGKVNKMEEPLLYNSAEVADRIDKVIAEKGIVKKTMLKELGLSINTTSNMRNGRSIASDSLARIADYLKVSTDYLLGRTEEATKLERKPVTDLDDLSDSEIRKRFHQIVNETDESELEMLLYMLEAAIAADKKRKQGNNK